MLWRREWQSIPVFLPGKSHGWRSLLGYSPWGAKSWTRLSNFTSIFTFTFIFSHSIVSDSATPRTEAFQAFLSFTISQSLLKLISIVLVMPFNHLILCYSLLPLPLVFPSIRVFSNESALRIRWPKYWSFSFSISPSSEYSGLISFRIDWFDLFAEQGILKSLLQHHGLKASILKCSAFFYCPDLAHIKENLRHIMSSHSYISVISYSPTKKKAKEELFSYATMPLLHLTN